jgi:sugar phosphate isomerase/epimerase
MHENDTKDDLHQMPYTFGRNAEDGLDWKRFAQALKEIQFDGTLSFETYPCMHSFPDSVRETILETIHAIGMDLKNQIEMD